MTDLLSLETLVSLLTLTTLELVLGIDNIVVLSLLLQKLPPERRPLARRLGLAGALVMRLALLGTLSFAVRLTRPLVTVLGHAVSGRDLILLGGGAFLLWKAAQEIYDKLEGDAAHGGGADARPRASARFGVVLAQIVALDIVFSLDSVIAAVGMARRLEVMAAAVVLGAALMMLCARGLGELIDRHPSVRVLALSFLFLVGTLLVAEGAGRHLPRGYAYFAMAFAGAVEAVNVLGRRRAARAAAADGAERSETAGDAARTAA